MVPVPFRIRATRQELDDTFTLDLEPPDGRPFVFRPGQFNMLYVFGVGEVPISISGDPGTPGILTHTTRAVGAVTNAMWTLKPGQEIGVRGPFGTPWPVEAAIGRDVVIVAGGIGLAPLRPLVHSVLADRARFGKVLVLYGARTPEDILYAEEVATWRSRFDLQVDVTVDRATGAWAGQVGVVTNLIARGGFDARNATAYVCGPEVMMRFAADALLRRGVPAEDIWLSMERNMKCAVGVCGHCQWGGRFVCKDGPVFNHAAVGALLTLAEY
jgi:NAD(P)H-flavin reductase